jgi:hypothetical protein
MPPEVAKAKKLKCHRITLSPHRIFIPHLTFQKKSCGIDASMRAHQLSFLLDADFLESVPRSN